MPRPPDCPLGANFCPHSPLCSLYSIALSRVNNLFNIVYQAVKHPLDIHLHLAAQEEPHHFLACGNVAKPRSTGCLSRPELPHAKNK